MLVILKSSDFKKMNAMKAKQMLSGYAGKSDICDLFMKKEKRSKAKVDSLWDQYLEFIVGYQSFRMR